MLSGRLALITGSTGGIGLAIAKKFAKEGATIAMIDVHTQAPQALKELQNISENKHSYQRCDVSNKVDVQRLFNELKKYNPSLCIPDIIVNNAGVYISKQLTEFEEDDIDQILNINLKGTILITQEATRHLLAQNEKNKPSHTHTYASIINISSLSGKNGCPTETPYSASKAGVEGFTRSVAKELGHYKIRCNAILPGLIR
jgi:NAD(P)-dependent dehydrogenase (short-subunit alcohol dehydrogenase family)